MSGRPVATSISFKPATKTVARARVALIGPSGCGKTYTALRVATGLGGRVAVIDTEHGSASKYADVFSFDVCQLDSFSPRDYIAAMKAAEAAGYDVLVIDSLSHEWMGPGGALEMVDAAAARSKGNTYVAWRDVTPEHNRLIDAIIRSPCHVVATMRSKTEYVVESQNGKSVPRKVGMAPVQRDGMDYEFDVVGELDLSHRLSVSKTRCPALDGALISQPGEELGRTLLAWLTDGAAENEAPDLHPIKPFKRPSGRSGGSKAAEQPAEEWADHDLDWEADPPPAKADGNSADSIAHLCRAAMRDSDEEALPGILKRINALADRFHKTGAMHYYWLARVTIQGTDGLDAPTLRMARGHVAAVKDCAEKTQALSAIDLAVSMAKEAS